MKKSILFIALLLVFKAEAQSSALVIADSLYATGNYANAINYYAKEGSQKGSLQIARAYNSIGNYDKAIVQYESLVAESPDLQIARFELGKLYHKMKRFDDSRKLFTGLVRDETNNPEFLYYQGESFRELEQAASSLVAYKKAVAVDSTHLKSLFQLGKYFVVQRETNDALLYLEKGLRFYPNDVSFINLKALVLFNNNQYAEALPFFERLIELGETKEFVYKKLAHCYYKTWAFDKSKNTYKTLVEMDPYDHEAYFNLGAVFYKDRQNDSALIYVKKAIKVQEVTFEKEYDFMAGLYRSEEDLKNALKYYKLAHAEASEEPRYYYQICAMIDQTTKDPKVKLRYYEGFIEKYGTKHRYYSDAVAKRISKLKEEIHLGSD